MSPALAELLGGATPPDTGYSAGMPRRTLVARRGYPAHILPSAAFGRGCPAEAPPKTANFAPWQQLLPCSEK